MKKVQVLALAIFVTTALKAQWNGESSTDVIWRKGNVGIGLVPSGSKLSVYQDISAVGDGNFLKFQLSGQSSNYFGLRHAQNNNLSIGFDDGDGFDSHIIVRNTGRVGIGVAPDFLDPAQLSVKGNMSVLGTDNYLYFKHDVGINQHFAIRHAQNNNLSIGFDNGNGFDSHIIVRNTGRVGIGVAPGFLDPAQLSVKGNMSVLGTDNYLYFKHDVGVNRHFAIRHAQNNNLSIGFDDGNGFDSHIIVRNTGRVGIGVAPGFNDESLLLVNGQIKSEEVKCEIVGGADFVFHDSYNLRSLKETEDFIRKNKHLPEIAPAEEMIENGLELGKMNIKLLQKVEELTLYMIELNKQIKSQHESITILKEENKVLKAKVSALD